MNYIVILSISIIILFSLVIILLLDSKTSNNASRKNDKLTIWSPLKKEQIDLKTDLKSWNIQKVKYLSFLEIYALSLELKSGDLKKVYSRSLNENLKKIIDYLEERENIKHLKNNSKLETKPIINQAIT